MLPLRFLSSVACVSTFAFATLAHAQNVVKASRISGQIDESFLTTLRGNVTPRARLEFDKGEAAPATELNSMRVVLARSPGQEAALELFMAQQLDRSSPNYHHWLTPEQFGKSFGPADSDIAAIVAWLQSHGLKVDSISTGRTSIAFSGTPSQVEEAFHTAIHSFDDHAEQFFSNTSDPRIPAALSAVVSGVAGLNTIRPKAHNVPGSIGKFDPASRQLVPAQLQSPSASPDLTTGSNGSYFLYVVPSDAATIYNTPNSLNLNFPPANTPYDGTGVTIGIGGDALIQATTVADYRAKFLGNSTPPTITNIVPSATVGADTNEAYLDVEISGGLAPGASLIFYTSNSLQNAIEQALTDNKIDIFSLSFGECELDLGNAGNQLLNGYWQQAAAQGIAVTVSTGDSGSAGCDNGNLETSAVHGLQVSGFASTPYNIAVGGTDFPGLVTSFTTYVNTTNGTPFFGSAKNYIPESTWNDSTSIDTVLEVNVPALDAGNATNIFAAGGGLSACSTNTTSGTIGTCTSGYPKPSWQRGAGVPNDSGRDIPDISLFSGAGMDGAAWLVCTDDPMTGGDPGQTTNCVPNSSNQFGFKGYGGTSTSAPAIAGILALVQQKAGSRLGLAVKTLYDLFNGSRAGLIYHDVTVGNNAVVCTPASPDCSKNSVNNYFLSGYNTTTGYDLATGMGSVDATALISNWASASSGETAMVTVTPSATNITSIQGLTVTVTIAGTGGFPTPTGTVTLSDGTSYNSSATLSGTGTASFTIAAGALPAGTDTLTATYSGDSTYSTDSGTAVVTVTSVAFTLSATSPNPASVTRGIGSSSTLTVSSKNGYAGSIALSCAVTTSPAGAVNLPSCTIATSPIVLSATTTTATTTVNITTTQPVASLERPRTGGLEGAGGAVLALLVFFGIPSRRRGWRGLVALLLMTAAFLSVSACGNSGGNGGGGGNPGTTAGNYTFTITGTATPAVTPSPTTTLTLTVN